MRIKDPDIRHLAKLAEAAGWTVTQTRNNHLQFKDPTGGIAATTGSTPSDRRATLNLTAALRRGGLDIPRKGR